MKYQNITNLLGTMPDDVPRCITKKWIEVHVHAVMLKIRSSKQIRFKTSMLRSDVYDFSDLYIVMKGTIIPTKTNGRRIIDIKNMILAFKNNAPLTNCISKINNVLISNAEDLDVVMPMYKLLEKQQEVCRNITAMSLMILLPSIIMQAP